MQNHQVVRTAHLNHQGSLFGGQLLQWVDECAYMAAKKDLYAKNEAYQYPSYFGSHASMVDQTLTDALHKVLAGEVPDLQEDQLALVKKLIKHPADDLVVLRDEHKEPYSTSRKLLDNGMADPNRYAQSRVEYLCAAKKD